MSPRVSQLWGGRDHALILTPGRQFPVLHQLKGLPLWSPLWSLRYQLVVWLWLSPPEQLPHPLGRSAHLPGPGQATPCRPDQDRAHFSLAVFQEDDAQ